MSTNQFVSYTNEAMINDRNGIIPRFMEYLDGITVTPYDQEKEWKHENRRYSEIQRWFI